MHRSHMNMNSIPHHILHCVLWFALFFCRPKIPRFNTLRDTKLITGVMPAGTWGVTPGSPGMDGAIPAAFRHPSSPTKKSLKQPTKSRVFSPVTSSGRKNDLQVTISWLDVFEPRKEMLRWRPRIRNRKWCLLIVIMPTSFRGIDHSVGPADLISLGLASVPTSQHLPLHVACIY